MNNNNLFRSCKTLDELKKAYRAATLANHPDRGGDVEAMKRVNLDYHLDWSEMTTMQVSGWSNMATVRKVYQKLAAKDKNEDIIRMQGFYSKDGKKNDGII